MYLKLSSGPQLLGKSEILADSLQFTKICKQAHRWVGAHNLPTAGLLLTRLRAYATFALTPPKLPGVSASLLGAHHIGDSVENKPASLLVVSLGKALNGTPPSLCGGQMVGPSSLPVVVAQSDERHANRA